MGLAVEVGALTDLAEHDPEGVEWLRESFDSLNEVLAEKGLPRHDEPERLPPLKSRADVGSYPYSFLHYLRRIYVRIDNDPSWMPEPVADDEDPSQDPAVEEASSMFESHLLCHSDCEGFYLPIDFDEVLIDESNQERVEGGLLGSSYRLMEELVRIAPPLGIALQGGALSDAEAERINQSTEREEGLWIERLVWISLFEACRLSIEHKTAIHFC